MSPDLASLGIQVNPHGPIEQRVACPQCSRRERDDALGVNTEKGVYHCFRCGWSGCIGRKARPHAQIVAHIDDPLVTARKRERLRDTWRQSVPLWNPGAQAVCAYLRARGLDDILKRPPVVLRAHPGLEYWQGTESFGRFPAMLGLFHGAAGNPVTLHVTYLQREGSAKASVPNAKKILGVPVRGATRGGSIRLYEPEDGVLGVAEGIETALSFRLLCGFPTWASFCADNLERIWLPQSLRELHIGIDVDQSGKGEAVARALAHRVRQSRSHLRVTLWRPDIEGPGDLNDELASKRMRVI